MVAIASSSASQSAIADILARLLNQPNHEQQFNPLAAYLGALSAVLVGVVHADSQVTEEEKQRLGKILAQFIPSGSAMQSVVQLLIQGVRNSKIYAKPTELATLMSLFGESEKLLLMMLGYEMATADGEFNPREQKYLRIIAQNLHLKEEWMLAVEAGLVHQQMSDALNEVRYLLDPARFQALDPVFSQAASQMLLRLPETTKHHGTGVKVGYETLAVFQAQRQQLDRLCGELWRLLADCNDRASLPQHLGYELQTISKRLQSQKFRVAVVGEFSQGKSTLLNALLGEEIQPTRVIPCSGSITVLRYGEQKRVICRYRNRPEETIPLEEYQIRASIPDDLALSNRADALASDVLEIVYEHPGLVLCRHGVELIDSPGLNEHPERTRITNQLLENVDAVIFLANGSRPMTQGERELLHSLKLRLNGGQDDRPANNLFVLVNFMDLVRREHDRQQVRQLVENFVFGNAHILETPKQLHFISAQAALEAICDGDYQSVYLQAFQGFTQVLETFLTQERGALINQRSQTELHSVIQALTLQLTQAEETLVGKVAISNAAKQDILSKIGEASGYLANLHTLIQSTSEQKRDTVRSLEIKPYLEKCIEQKSSSWSSKQSDKSKVSKEFFEKFQSDLSDAISEWTQTTVIQDTLASSLQAIDSNIQSKIYQFQKSAESIDKGVGSQLASQLVLTINQVAPQFNFKADGNSDDWSTAWNIGIGGISGLGGGGLLAGGVALAVSSIAFFPVVLTGGAIVGLAAAGAALGSAIGGTIGFFTPADQEAIRKEIVEEGFKQFQAQDGMAQLTNALDELVNNLFNQRLTTIQAVTRQYIGLLNSLLTDSEAAHTLVLNEAAAASQWHQEQRSQVLALQSRLDTLLA
ncbi:dynamin family protein [Pantanalinema rosaneae CENA516]|uniref:dynamin family protein n=1 Tax=Pantanalinema rosaneae TaxID=1620701 RepID=UPI003D6F3F4A